MSDAARARLLEILAQILQSRGQAVRGLQIIARERLGEIGEDGDRIGAGLGLQLLHLVDAGRLHQRLARFHRFHQQVGIAHRFVLGHRGVEALEAEQISRAAQRVLQHLVGFVEGDGLALRQGALLGGLGGEAVGMDGALEAEIALFDHVEIDVEVRLEPEPAEVIKLSGRLDRAAGVAEQRLRRRPVPCRTSTKQDQRARRAYRPLAATSVCDIRRGRIRHSRSGPSRSDS